MPKPAHVRVTFEGVVGTVAAPVERWAFNLNFPHDALSASESAAVDDPIAAEAKANYMFWLSSHLPSDTILTQVKVARVGGDGHVERRGDGSYRQGVWIGSGPGTGAPQAVPLQTALCVSLKTARAGSTGKGRFFLPWPAKPIQTADKRLASVGATDIATASQGFLNALATTLTYAPQVVSSKGYMSEVTGVRVGRVPDTMRSRRADLIESYVDLPLA